MSKYEALGRLTRANPEQTMMKQADSVDLPKAPEGAFSRLSNWISAPQRYVMNEAAQAIGVKGDPNNSEESAYNIVQKAGDALGIPEDSTLGNVGKSIAVAGLETFADPTGILPVGKVMKGIQAAKKTAEGAAAAEKFQRVTKMFRAGDKSFPASNTAEAMKIKKSLEDSGQLRVGSTLVLE